MSDGFLNLVMWALPVTLWTIALRALTARWLLRSRGAVVPARIAGVARQGHAFPGSSTKFKIEYTTKEGEVFVSQSPLDAPGHAIRMVYDPQKPTRAMTVEELMSKSASATYWGTALVAAFTTVLAVLVMLSG